MDNYFDHIEDYLKEHLSQEDRTLFDSEMSVNEQLAFAVKEYELLQGAQDVLIEDDIQASIDEVRAELNQNKSKPQEHQSANQIWLRPVGIAASIILLLGLGYLAMRGFVQPLSENKLYALSSDELRDKYFREPVDVVERGSDERETGIHSPQKPCEIAHYLMANKQYQEALDTFRYSLQDTDQICKWKSEFYSALIYVIQDKRGQAKLLLEKIVIEQEHGFSDKAKELLKDLN